MADKKINRELYSFSVAIEEEVVKEEIKKVRRKNKETGKMETIEETKEKTVKEEVPVKVISKKPTRTQVEDGDMFYSVWLNKFIKMGLLTRSMLAKQHVDLGGSLNQEEKQRFANLYLKLYEKQQQVIRYSAKDRAKLTVNEKARLEKAISELAVVRKELADYEAAQASVFDHTADVKARNRAITWFLLHLTHAVRGDEDPSDAEPMFEGVDYEEKYDSYQELDEGGDELFGKTIDRLSSIITIWYMSGIQTQEDFEAVLEEMSQETDDYGNLQEDISGDTQETEEEVEEEVVEEAKKPKAKRGRKPKAKVSS